MKTYALTYWFTWAFLVIAAATGDPARTNNVGYRVGAVAVQAKLVQARLRRPI